MLVTALRAAEDFRTCLGALPRFHAGPEDLPRDQRRIVPFPLQVVGLTLQVIAFLAQALVLAPLTVHLALEALTLSLRRAFDHALVMPESPTTYKYDFLDRSAARALTRQTKTTRARSPRKFAHYR